MIVVKVYKQSKLTHTGTFETKSKADYWVSECEKLNLFNSNDFSIVYEEVGIELSTIKFRELREKTSLILQETDWTQLSDTLLGKPKLKSIYREYRKYIRKANTDFNNDTVLTFKLLSFEEWLKIKSYFKGHDYEE